MKLWILRPIDDEISRPGTDVPVWSWDCSYGFVVRAENENAARDLISKADDMDEYRFTPGDEGAKAWLDPELTSCTELEAEGTPAIIMRDFLAG